jgi:glycosyltransferase involved in cell wall biosynthesis
MSSPLRVLMVLNAFELDGPGLFVCNLCRAIKTSDAAVIIEVCAVSRDGVLRHRFESVGIAAHFFPTRSLSGFRAFRKWLREKRQSQVPFDVVHTHLLWPDLLLRFLKREIGSAVLLSTNHGLHAVGEKPGLFGLGYRLLESQTRSRVDAFVAVSQSLYGEMIHRGYPKERTVAIPNGIDLDAFQPLGEKQIEVVRGRLGLRPHQPFLLAVGNFRPVKNHALLLEAMVQVRNLFPDVFLLLVGHGPLKSQYLQMIRERSLEANVRVMAPVGRKLPLLLGSADVLIHPSKTESFGLVVAESIACGTPVVATRVGALPELVKEGETGLLVESESILSLAQAVCALIAEPAAREQFSKAGMDHAREFADIQRCATKYGNLWRKFAHR